MTSNIKRRKTAVNISSRWFTPLTDPNARQNFLDEFFEMQVIHGTQYFAKKELHWSEK